MESLLSEVRAARNVLLPADQARAIRRAAGVSQSRMAAELGVHTITLGRWERGEMRPRGAARARYVELLQALATEIEGQQP